jgi:glucose-1-phosphate cytidylyltransferase
MQANPTAEVPVVILCGGRGTRLRERTSAIPKSLVEIGDKPILWHLIGIYASQGFRRFLLLTGFRGELIQEFVDHARWGAPVQLECVATGDDTPTGGRLAKVADHLRGGTFCLTYADGLADINLRAELSEHTRNAPVATMTVVRPRIQWGIATVDDDDRVRGFEEKPQIAAWVNGGFFVMEPSFLDYVDETCVLERDPLERLAAEGRLGAYRHHGFWDCMDTYKDAITLNDLWSSGEAPWQASALERRMKEAA